jgi:uncharacterized coiled-coil DUF342 family protein
VQNLKDTVRKQDQQLYELKIKNDDIESAYDRLKKDLLNAKQDNGSFDESLANLKKKIADDEKVIQTLTTKQSELNGRITLLTKEKS